MNKQRYALLVVGVVALTCAPSSAQAISTPKSYSGDDYSTNSSTGHHVYAHDGENDGHDVSADYQRTGSGTQYSVVNGNGPGTTSDSGYFPGSVYRHRIVELVPFSADDYGDWVYPS